MMQQASCPFDTGGCTPEPCWEENGYTGLRCPQCGVIYISPRPDETEMAALYDADAAGGASAAGHLAYTHERHLDARYALRAITQMTGAAATGATLLEVGPGGGQFLREARAQGYAPHAVELNAAQAAHLRDEMKVPTHHGAVTDDDVFPGMRFDVIFHRDLVSHLHEPATTFAHLRTRLAPGGVMVFETGNGGDLSPYWLRRIGRLSYPEHLYLFGERSLAALLDASGFELIAMRRHSIVPWMMAIKMIRAVRPAPPAANAANAADADDADDADDAGDGAGTGDNTATAASADRSPATAPPALTLPARIKGRLVHTVKYRAFRWLPRHWPATMLIAARSK